MEKINGSDSTVKASTSWDINITIKCTRPPSSAGDLNVRCPLEMQMEDPRSIPEISDAIELFQKYEKSHGDMSAIRGFDEAVKILNDYLEDDPDSQHKDFIQNLKFSYTRALLRKLASVDKKDFQIWLEHVLIVVDTLKYEAKALMANYPELENDFNEFFEVWKEYLRKLIALGDAKKRYTPPNT